MSRSESIADWSPSAASSVAPVLDGDQSACSPRECLNQFTRSTCPTNGDHLIDKILSIQEQTVLSLIGALRSDTEIASTLTITVRTAETHRFTIMKKLNLRSRNELLRYTRDNGFY